MLFIAHRGVELRLETSCRDPILLSDEKVEGYIKSAVAMIEANKCYIAWWRTTDNPMNIECQLFVSHGPDGKVQETRAVYFCMDKANRRTQTHNTRDKLEPPFTQYCMLRTQNNGYLRLDIRRHRGGNDELFVGDLIDDGEPHAALQVKFKRPLGSSMGRQETAQSGGRSRPLRTRASRTQAPRTQAPRTRTPRTRAPRTRPHAQSSHWSHSESEDVDSDDAEVRDLQNEWQEAEQEEEEAIEMVKAELAKKRKRTVAIRDIVKKRAKSM